MAQFNETFKPPMIDQVMMDHPDLMINYSEYCTIKFLEECGFRLLKDFKINTAWEKFDSLDFLHKGNDGKFHRWAN